MGRVIATLHTLLDNFARWREVAFQGEGARLADRLLPAVLLVILLAVFVMVLVVGALLPPR